MHRIDIENLNHWLTAVYFEKEKTIYFCNSCPSHQQQWTVTQHFNTRQLAEKNLDPDKINVEVVTSPRGASCALESELEMPRSLILHALISYNKAMNTQTALLSMNKYFWDCIMSLEYGSQ